jgi:hypothetical protein
MRQILNHPTYEMSDGDLRDHLLDTLGTLFNRRGSNINDFNIPRKSVITSSNFTNCLFDEELSYDESTLLEESRNIILQLNNEQWHAWPPSLSWRGAAQDHPPTISLAPQPPL